MKYCWFLLLLCLFPLFAIPAEVKEGNDSTYTKQQIDSLNDLANASKNINPENVKKYASIALTFSQHTKYLKGQADALSCLSSYYFSKEEYIKCLDCSFKIIDLYNHLQDFNKLTTSYGEVAMYFVSIRNFDLAEKYLVIMAQTAKKTTNLKTQGTVYINYARFYILRHEYKAAIRNLFLSIPYFQKTKDWMDEGAAYKFLGDAYIQTNQYFKADYSYRMAISCYALGSNTTNIAIIYTRIAHIYQSLNDNAKNLEYNLKAMHLREKVGQTGLIASSYLNVGEAYWLLGRKDSANFFLGKALNLAKQINHTYLLEAIYSQLSDFANEEKRYKDALSFYSTCIEYRNMMRDKQTRSEIAILVANRSIRTSEAQNDLIRQENLIQDLQIRNRRIQTFLFEVAFLILVSLILFIDTLARNNRKRKNELKVLNDRLQQEINERIEAEKRLNRSEVLHRFLAENTVDVISLLDANLKRLYISPSCEKLYGYSQEEILQMDSLLNLIHPDYHAAVNQKLLEMYRTKNTIRYVYKAVRRDGTIFWAEENINPVLHPVSGEVKDLITVARNISERVQYEEELAENARQKEYLLREIHNRVKNNFTILTSLMNMQRELAQDSELNRSLTDLQLRVRTMSLVHEKLYQTQEISSIPFDNYLQHLAMIISSSFNNDRIRLQTDIRPCQLAIDMALPMGLIINELITNVYKYAFPGNNTGNLWIDLLPEENGMYSISIRDDGIGLPEDFTLKTTQSMGTQIVGILIQQVEARLEVTSNGGACFRILFSPKQE
jgi:PAS domain S-box-containing protein